MARTYSNLGLYALAHGLSASALENRRRLLGPKNRKTLESMTQLGWILDREGHDAEAEKLTRQTVDQARRVLGPEDQVTLEAMDNLAVILEKQGRYQGGREAAASVGRNTESPAWSRRPADTTVDVGPCGRDQVGGAHRRG